MTTIENCIGKEILIEYYEEGIDAKGYEWKVDKKKKVILERVDKKEDGLYMICHDETGLRYSIIPCFFSPVDRSPYPLPGIGREPNKQGKADDFPDLGEIKRIYCTSLEEQVEFANPGWENTKCKQLRIFEKIL